MVDPQSRETIESWVGDFLDTPRAREHPGVVLEYAPEVLVRFLVAACEARGTTPDDIEAPDLRPALLDGVGALEIPGSVRERVPGLCGDLLEELEAQGRLSGGRTLGLTVRALKTAYLDRTSGKGTTLRAAAPPVGRNDPCPCGSGKKYKKCCMGRLGP